MAIQSAYRDAALWLILSVICCSARVSAQWHVRNFSPPMTGLVTDSNGVHVLGSGRMFSSADGAQWPDEPTARVPADAVHFTRGPDKFVAAAHSGQLYESESGETWLPTARLSHGLQGSDLTGLHWIEGRYYAMNQQALFLSTNGAQWQTIPLWGVNSVSEASVGNGRLVLVGAGAYNNSAHYLASSPQQPFGGNQIPNLRAAGGIAFGNGRFVVVGRHTNDNVRSYFSTNGVDWKTTAELFPSPSFPLPIVSFANGQFITQSADNSIHTSLNGEVWQKVGEALPWRFRKLEYFNGRYVAIIWDQQTTLHSPDLQQWSPEYPGVGAPISGILPTLQGWYAHGDGAFIADHDAEIWQYHTNGLRIFDPVAYGNGLFLQSSFTRSGDLRVSRDGIGFTSTGEKALLIGFYNDVFIRNTAIASAAVIDSWSSDASTWRPATGDTNLSAWKFVPTAAGVFAFGPSYKTTVRSRDGKHWTTNALSGPGVNGVAAGKGSIVFVGSESGAPRFHISHDDGQTWGSGALPGTNIMQGVAYGGGLYVAVGHNGAILESANGMDWAPAVSGVDAPLFAVAYSKGKFVAVGGAGAILTRSVALNPSLQIRQVGPDVLEIVVEDVDPTTAVVEESADLESWQPSSGSLDGAGRMTISPGENRRFYRVRSP